MNNDAEYAESHRLEGAMRFAEIDALEATQKADCLRARAELSEVFGEPMDTHYLHFEADKLDRIAREFEDKAQDAYDIWAAYCSEHEL